MLTHNSKLFQFLIVSTCEQFNFFWLIFFRGDGEGEILSSNLIEHYLWLFLLYLEKVSCISTSESLRLLVISFLKIKSYNIPAVIKYLVRLFFCWCGCWHKKTQFRSKFSLALFVGNLFLQVRWSRLKYHVFGKSVASNQVGQEEKILTHIGYVLLVREKIIRVTLFSHTILFPNVSWNYTFISKSFLKCIISM